MFIHLILHHGQVSIFILRHKYDAATTEDLIVACNELVSSFAYFAVVLDDGPLYFLLQQVPLQIHKVPMLNFHDPD